MRALRWLVLLPAAAAALHVAIAATIATPYLAEQHLCPAADFAGQLQLRARRHPTQSQARPMVVANTTGDGSRSASYSNASAEALKAASAS